MKHEAKRSVPQLTDHTQVLESERDQQEMVTQAVLEKPQIDYDAPVIYLVNQLCPANDAT